MRPSPAVARLRHLRPTACSGRSLQRLPPQLPSPHALHRRLAPTRVLPQPLRLLPSRPAWRHYPQELTVPLLLLPRVSQRTKWRRLSTCAIFLPKREAC